MSKATLLFLSLIVTSCVKNRIPELISDVPVVRELPSLAYTKSLDVQEIHAKVIQNRTNLFNSVAVVEYRIKGQIQGSAGWRPYIKNFMVGKRWSVDHPPVGHIYLQPEISTKRSRGYIEESIDFDVTLQDTIKSGGWGKNNYTVYAGSKKSKFSFFHGK